MEFTNYCLAKLEVVRTMQKLRRDERGVTALEYGLVAAFVGTAIIAAMGALEGDMGRLFTRITAVTTAAVTP